MPRETASEKLLNEPYLRLIAASTTELQPQTFLILLSLRCSGLLHDTICILYAVVKMFGRKPWTINAFFVVLYSSLDGAVSHSSAHAFTFFTEVNFSVSGRKPLTIIVRGSDRN